MLVVPRANGFRSRCCRAEREHVGEVDNKGCATADAAVSASALAIQPDDKCLTDPNVGSYGYRDTLGGTSMTIRSLFCPSLLATLILLVAGLVSAQSADAAKASQSDASKLVYADFQNLQDGRPVSKRGGVTRLNRYSENPANPPTYRGMQNVDPPTPAAARVTAEDFAAAFEYELRIPNEWAGVNMEVFGLPEKDGKLVAEDVSGYKFITMRLFAKGPESIRLELITRGQGANLDGGYPTASFRVSPGFNTYKLKLDTFNQPQWATQLDLKRDVLKKLTSVTVGVFCDKCRLESGTVVVDNIAFEK